MNFLDFTQYKLKLTISVFIIFSTKLPATLNIIVSYIRKIKENLIQGCHQIKEIRKIHGNLDTIRENQREMIDLVKNQGKSNFFKMFKMFSNKNFPFPGY